VPPFIAPPTPRHPNPLRGRRIAWRPDPLFVGGFGAATVLSLLIGTENWWVFQKVGQPIPWIWAVILELPVWYTWLLFTPGIIWLAGRFPVAGRKRWRNLLLHLPFSAAVTLLGIAVIALLKRPVIQWEPSFHGWITSVGNEFARIFGFLIPMYFVMLAAAHAVLSYRENERRSRREAELATLLARAQRDLLRMQLQPHFLFNTLHAVSALMERDVPAARRMITRLSDLLRLALDDDSRHEVSVEEEIEFLDRYAEIQKIRFGGRLEVTYDVAADARRLLVPRLVLQPLVENSITHGLSRLERRGGVTVEARRRDGYLLLRVLDDGVGLEGGEVAREGVGIGNTRARLEHLYGADHRFSIANLPCGGCEVRIEIPAGTEERTPVNEPQGDDS